LVKSHSEAKLHSCTENRQDSYGDHLSQRPNRHGEIEPAHILAILLSQSGHQSYGDEWKDSDENAIETKCLRYRYREDIERNNIQDSPLHGLFWQGEYLPHIHFQPCQEHEIQKAKLRNQLEKSSMAQKSPGSTKRSRNDLYDTGG